MADASVADQSPKAENTDTQASSDNSLETTTAKDGSLPINVSVPVSTPPATPAAPTPPVVPTVAATEKPIVVSEADLNPANTQPGASQSSEDQVTNEIENLSGEIQALEAKIDRLTGNIKAVSETPVEKKVEAPVAVEAPPPAPVPKSEPTTNPPVKADNKPPKANPLDDIYSRVAAQEKSGDGELKTPDSDEAHEVGGGSSLAIIGEVLTVFGIISFLLMAAFPLYKSLLSTDVQEAVRLIGWPTTVVGLAIGLILSLFSKGKLFTKIFALIILLISVVFYFGAAGFERFLGPLASMLDSVFSFYR